MNRYQKILTETQAAFDARRPLPPRPRGPRGAEESNTERKAKEQARSWNWDRIKGKLDAEVASLQESPCNLDRENDYEGADDGEHRAVIYLGSYVISPSGKIYTPFAHSNLTKCPACNGTGRRKPRNSIERIHAAEWLRLSIDGNDCMAWPGAMTPEWRAHVDRVNAVCHVNSDGTLDCTECAGHQYAEAWADRVWTGEMERLAQERGLSFDYEDDGYFVFKYFTVNVDAEDGATNEEV